MWNKNKDIDRFSAVVNNVVAESCFLGAELKISD